MISSTVTFFMIAVMAALMGFGPHGGIAAMIAKVCSMFFIVLFVISLIRDGRRAI